MSVRAKFRCHTKHEFDGGNVGVEMSAVYSSDPNHVNKQFAAATPSGNFMMHIRTDGPHAFFKVGHEYYLDFTDASAGK